MKTYTWLAALLVGLSACANQTENKHFHSYVDETHRVHTVETEQKAKSEPQKEPVVEVKHKAPSDTPFEPFDRLIDGGEHSQKANYSMEVDGSLIHVYD